MKQSQVKYIIIHCSATPEGRDFTAADIDAWHRARGFNKIGYHYVIRLDGTVEPGRSESETGAHCLGKNSCSIGICYIGGLDSSGKPKDTRTAAQKRSITTLLTDLKRRYPNARICGHRDFANKACPSFDATSEYRNPAILTSAFIVLTTTSCKSSKVSHEATAMDCAIDTRLQTRTALLNHINDSIDIRLSEPRVEVIVNDTVRAILTAGQATVARARGQTTRVAKQTERHDSIHTQTTATIDTRADTNVATPSFTAPALSGLLLLVLGAIILRRNHKSQPPNS